MMAHNLVVLGVSQNIMFEQGQSIELLLGNAADGSMFSVTISEDDAARVLSAAGAEVDDEGTSHATVSASPEAELGTQF